MVRKKKEPIAVSDFSDKKKYYDGQPRICLYCGNPTTDFVRRLYGTVNEYFSKECANYFSST